MNKVTDSTSEALPEGLVSNRIPRINPAGSRDTSAPAAKFLLQRTRYFTETGVIPGRLIRSTDIVEAANAQTSARLLHTGSNRERRHISRG